MAASSLTFVWMRNNVDKLYLHVYESSVFSGKCRRCPVASRPCFKVRMELVVGFWRDTPHTNELDPSEMSRELGRNSGLIINLSQGE